MSLPTSSLSVLALVVIALPAFVSAGIRRWARGERPEDRSPGLSIARGLIFAVLLTCLYVLLLGAWLYEGLEFGSSADTLLVVDARQLAWRVLVYYIAIPAGISFLANFSYIEVSSPEWLRNSKLLSWMKLPMSKHGYTNGTNPWDYSVSENQHAWVRIKRVNGDWIGGWYTKGSIVSTYPENPSLYISEQWLMADSGEFLESLPGAGVYLTLRDDDVVLWQQPQPRS